jgi:uncharacterized protein YebE (UPF0316 family)
MDVFGLDQTTLLLGLLIFIARVVDVSLGTIRTIVIVQGKTSVAFLLGFLEVLIWITIVSTVVNRISQTPVLVLFYASGFATGNVVGILTEKRLGFGSIILRVISRDKGVEIARRLRDMGQGVTVFKGEGMRGEVTQLYIACRRRDLRWILPVVKQADPDAFYITEQVCDVSKILRPVSVPVTGWRSPFGDK